ncbi:hypothetical protein ACJX0J_014023 [Zea mays]
MMLSGPQNGSGDATVTYEDPHAASAAVECNFYTSLQVNILNIKHTVNYNGNSCAVPLWPIANCCEWLVFIQISRLFWDLSREGGGGGLGRLCPYIYNMLSYNISRHIIYNIYTHHTIKIMLNTNIIKMN